MICALMCAITVYLTKGASYDPHAANMCEMEIAHLEAVEKTLACDEEYIIVSNAEYGFLKPNYFEFKASAKYQYASNLVCLKGSFEQNQASLVENIRLAVREEISGIEKKIDSLKIPKQRKRTHDVNDEIPIAQSAIDFGVTRQTIHNWEKYETEASPYNKSNQYGYYSALRRDLNLREAYYRLVEIVQNYNKAKTAFEKNGRRFRVKFAPFQEGWMSRQIKQT